MEPLRGDQPEEEGVGAGPDLALPDDSLGDDGVDRLRQSVLVQGDPTGSTRYRKVLWSEISRDV